MLNISQRLVFAWRVVLAGVLAGASVNSATAALFVSFQQGDLRVLPPDNWGAGLHYFTGAQLHNIARLAAASPPIAQAP